MKTSKRCARCLIEKPYSEFYRYKYFTNRKGGLSERCTECKIRREKVIKAANKETIEYYLNGLGGRTKADICYDDNNKKFIPMYRADGGIYRDYIPERYL